MAAHRIVLAVLVALVLVTAAPQANGAAGTPITSCGQTVTTNAYLAQDLDCGAYGVIAGASGITIDLKGFTLRGTNDGFHTGIYNGDFDKVTIKNGVIRNFYVGVLAVGGADSF